MKCSEVRIWLGALADGEVRDPTRRQAMEEHLGACPSCRQEYATQQEMKRLVGSMERQQASAFLATRVTAGIRARPRPAFGPLQLTYVAAVFLAALIVTGGLLFGLPDVARRSDTSGLFKELPGSASHLSTRESAWGPLTRRTPGSFYEFVEVEHERATELVRARSEWAEDLESLLEQISEDEAVDEETHLKELPSEQPVDEKEERVR